MTSSHGHSLAATHPLSIRRAKNGMSFAEVKGTTAQGGPMWIHSLWPPIPQSLGTSPHSHAPCLALSIWHGTHQEYIILTISVGLHFLKLKIGQKKCARTFTFTYLKMFKPESNGRKNVSWIKVQICDCSLMSKKQAVSQEIAIRIEMGPAKLTVRWTESTWNVRHRVKRHKSACKNALLANPLSEKHKAEMTLLSVCVTRIPRVSSHVHTITLPPDILELIWFYHPLYSLRSFPEPGL